VSYRQALNYCATRGGLPTIRQLALALNSREVFDEKPRIPGENVRRISLRNEPSFYYIEGGSYVRPSDEQLLGWFWSSSLSVFGSQIGYVFHGLNSQLIVADRSTVYGSVRCLEY